MGFVVVAFCFLILFFLSLLHLLTQGLSPSSGVSSIYKYLNYLEGKYDLSISLDMA